MDEAIRQFVRFRAEGRCEYCHILEATLGITFHVEHIIARQHLGGDELENLALACDRCNLLKGPNLATIDPVSERIVELFHPRRHNWADHFALASGRIDGRTTIGRATVRLLQMNLPVRVQLRRVVG